LARTVRNHDVTRGAGVACEARVPRRTRQVPWAPAHTRLVRWVRFDSFRIATAVLADSAEVALGVVDVTLAAVTAVPCGVVLGWAGLAYCPCPLLAASADTALVLRVRCNALGVVAAISLGALPAFRVVDVTVRTPSCVQKVSSQADKVGGAETTEGPGPRVLAAALALLLRTVRGDGSSVPVAVHFAVTLLALGVLHPPVSARSTDRVVLLWATGTVFARPLVAAGALALRLRSVRTDSGSVTTAMRVRRAQHTVGVADAVRPANRAGRLVETVVTDGTVCPAPLGVTCAGAHAVGTSSVRRNAVGVSVAVSRIGALNAFLIALDVTLSTECAVRACVPCRAAAQATVSGVIGGHSVCVATTVVVHITHSAGGVVHSAHNTLVAVGLLEHRVAKRTIISAPLVLAGTHTHRLYVICAYNRSVVAAVVSLGTQSARRVVHTACSASRTGRLIVLLRAGTATRPCPLIITIASTCVFLTRDEDRTAVAVLFRSALLALRITTAESDCTLVARGLVESAWAFLAGLAAPLIIAITNAFEPVALNGCLGMTTAASLISTLFARRVIGTADLAAVALPTNRIVVFTGTDRTVATCPGRGASTVARQEVG
jgi:hypothetical protein